MGAAMIPWLALGTALVGFSEEIAYRGLALVGFRGGYSEVKVWLFTSILFGLLHGVNVVLGQGAVLTVRQVIFAFVIGSVFYAIRRIRAPSWSTWPSTPCGTSGRSPTWPARPPGPRRPRRTSPPAQPQLDSSRF